MRSIVSCPCSVPLLSPRQVVGKRSALLGCPESDGLVVLVLPVAYAGWLYPEQLRIAWTEAEGEMRFTWVTYFPTTSQVWYRPLACTLTGQYTVHGKERKINAAEFLERTEYVHISQWRA